MPLGRLAPLSPTPTLFFFVYSHQTAQLNKGRKHVSSILIKCASFYILYFRNRLSQDIVTLAQESQDGWLSNTYFILFYFPEKFYLRSLLFFRVFGT